MHKKKREREKKIIKIFPACKQLSIECTDTKQGRVVGSDKKPRRRYRDINHSSAVSIPVEKHKFMDFPVRAYTGVSATSEIKTVSGNVARLDSPSSLLVTYRR